MAEDRRLPRWLRFGALPIGNQCLLMLLAGAMLGLFVPGAPPLLQPLGQAFLQASQVVVMPFLICELIAGFAGLSREARRSVLQGGALVLLALWSLAALLVLLLPSFLPALVYSGFFSGDLFLPNETQDLLRTYLPDNIFAALAADNFPAVVLFSAILGVLLQGMDERHQLLPQLQAMRQLFARLNKLVARTIPFGILALSTLAFSRLDVAQLVRIQALFQLTLIALLVLSVAFTGIVLALTPLSVASLWRIVRAPLVLTASSANLLIALPLLIEGLREELSRLPASASRQQRGQPEDLAPLISLGYALPTVGQITALLFIPFAAWSVDRAMTPLDIARMLATAVPASVAGIKAVVRQELLRQGLPLDLLQLVYVSGEWMYRFEKVLALEGLVVLALLVHFGAFRIRRLRWWPLLVASGAATGLLVGLGTANRAVLAYLLRDSYRNDARLMNLQPVLPLPAPEPLKELRPQPVTLGAILARRVLRLGVRRDGLPWAFRNRQGRLVGYDMDLMAPLARDLGVRLQVREGELAELERWLQRGEVDLAVGGIQSSPQRAIRHHLSRGYQGVHLALVVPDGRVGLIQNLASQPIDRPLRIGVADPDNDAPDLRDRIARELGGKGSPPVIELVKLDSKAAFFTEAAQRQHLDALLTTAEGGSAWTVLHPRTSLLAVFRDRLGSEMAVGVAGQDPVLAIYLDSWLARAQARGLTDALFRHWIRAES